MAENKIETTEEIAAAADENATATTSEVKKTKSKAKKSTKKSDGQPKKKKGGLTFKLLGGLLLSKMAKGGAKALRTNADEVNKLNVFPVPDGDTGDNMRMTVESGIAAIENMDSDDISKIMKALSHGMLLGARGNSGVIVSQFFAGISKGLKDKESADARSFGEALEEGVRQAYASVMTPTEGTILTVAREAVEYAVSRITEKSTIRTLFADLTREMHASVERTPEILSVLKDAGVVDSGGAGLFYIIDGFNRVLNGEEVPGDDDTTAESTSKSAKTEYLFNADSEMTFGYCTEALLQLQNSKCNPDEFDVEALKDFLISIGDSIVAFKTESIVKLHVHTFTPEKVLEYCRRYGEFLTVKIENMSVQHTDVENSEKAESAEAKSGASSAFSKPVAAPVSNSEAPKEKKLNARIAVSNGAGVDALFRDLGVDVIVEGGQTQNPSTNDFLAAFEQINAENIFIFPNNSNIIMAANQAAELYDKAKVYVIPSKNIGSGYVAISAIDFDNLPAEDILYEADEVMKRVTTGYVSPSIRDAEINGVRIAKGDTIGIINKEIVVSDADCTVATNKLVSMLLSLEDKFMLTAFCGQDATEEMKSALSDYLASEHPDKEIYFIEGGQPIYPFIFAAE